MANPQVPVHGETIESSWGADVVAAVVKRYVSLADQNTQNPSPNAGDLAYREDLGRFQVYSTGWGAGFGGHGNSTPDHPAFTFASDGNTGMYRAAADTLGFAANGSERLRIETNKIQLKGNLILFPDVSTTSHHANVWIDPASGRIFESTSTARHKSNVTPAPQLADIDLEPVTFTSDLDDDQAFIGFIAETVAEAEPRAGQHDDAGKVTDYDLRAVVAILAAKVNRLETRLAALEGNT